MYKINYDLNGKVGSIQRGNMSIPLCEGNSDYQEFLKWNKETTPPKLDLNSTIEVIKPAPVRDLAKEIETLKAQITALNKKVGIE